MTLFRVAVTTFTFVLTLSPSLIIGGTSNKILKKEESFNSNVVPKMNLRQNKIDVSRELVDRSCANIICESCTIFYDYYARLSVIEYLAPYKSKNGINWTCGECAERCFQHNDCMQWSLWFGGGYQNEPYCSLEENNNTPSSSPEREVSERKIYYGKKSCGCVKDFFSHSSFTTAPTDAPINAPINGFPPSSSDTTSPSNGFDSFTFLLPIVFFFYCICSAMRVQLRRNLQNRINNRNNNTSIPPPVGGHEESTDDDIQLRRAIILSSIIQKKVVKNSNIEDSHYQVKLKEDSKIVSNKKDLKVFHGKEDTLKDNPSIYDELKNVKENPQKNDKGNLIIDSIRSMGSNLMSKLQDNPEPEESLYSPKTCSICIEDYKEGEDVCWSRSDDCPHVFHLPCMMDWLMKNNDCPLCRADYLKCQESE